MIVFLFYLSEILFTAESVANSKMCFTNWPTQKLWEIFSKIFFLCHMYFNFIKNLRLFSLFVWVFFSKRKKHSISVVNILWLCSETSFFPCWYELKFGKALGRLFIVAMKKEEKRKTEQTTVDYTKCLIIDKLVLKLCWYTKRLFPAEN